ncbi:MAG: helix-turn-helix domain-containing protein [Terrimicrobiaceae bacterium]
MKSPNKPASKRNPDIAEILRIAPQIPYPMKWTQRVGDVAGILPGKISCFSRRKVTDLLGIPNVQENPASSIRFDHHHLCVLVVAVRGSGQICLDADTFDIHEGQAQFVSPFQFHSYTGIREGLSWIFITFEIQAPEEIKPLRSRPSLSIGPTEWVLLREFIQCWLREDRHNLLSHLLGLLLRLFCSGSSTALPVKTRPTSEADIISRINRYILPRLDQPIRVLQLAQALGTSESHLRAQFRELTGCSLGHHLREMRLYKARSLLHGTDLSVTQIAAQCGFESVYSFSRAFKAVCGRSPRAYRMLYTAPRD